MAAATLIWLLTVGVFGPVSAYDVKIIRAKTGDNVTLPCDAATYTPINVVEWSRTDEKTNIFFQNGGSSPRIDDPSYQGRVTLKDKDKGDLTLTLKNVTTKDSGTYECHIQKETNRKKRAVGENRYITTIYLNVEPGHQGGGQQDEQTGLVVTLGVLAVVLVLVLASVPLIVKKRSSLLSRRPSGEESEGPPLI